MIAVKPFLTYPEQIKKLQEHGCLVEDEGFARSVLERTNYYRFSAYFLPFKDSAGNYGEGTSFNRVYRIYEFDRKTRNILFPAVAGVEISLRSRLAYYHAEHYGPLGYMEAASFRDKGHDHSRFIKQVEG